MTGGRCSSAIGAAVVAQFNLHEGILERCAA